MPASSMGWESVAAALDHIRPSRIGHGVRAIENPDLVKRIADEGVVLECCPGSNVALKVFDELRRATRFRRCRRPAAR